MSNFSVSSFAMASNLSEDSVYLTTKAAHERLTSVATGDEQSQADKNLVTKWYSVRREMDRMIENRGKRYAGCNFDNYECRNDSQSKVVAALKDYAIHSKDHIASGKNVLLIGSKGAGKDHLIMALAKSVFMQTGTPAHWSNGVDLHEKLRAESMKNHRFHQEEAECQIFWVSDPLPPTGVLSEFQQAQMFRIIDARYSHQRPTWLTLNVADGAEAEARMGSQTVDRLRQDALILFCNWPSYREAQA